MIDSMSQEERKQIIEAALFAAAEPLSVERLQQLFDGRAQPSLPEIKECIAELGEECQTRGVEIQQVASGFRFQAKQDYAPWLQRLWEKRPPRYTRALLETLALIAYRQPVTRGEIEEVRGVAVSVDIIKKLTEREWIKVMGYRDVPGKPAMFGTTKKFLDYFNLKSLSNLPPLQDLVDLDQIEKQLNEQLALEVGSDSDKRVDDAEAQSMSDSVDDPATDLVADGAVPEKEEMLVEEE